MIRVIYKGRPVEAHLVIRESLFIELRESYPQKVVMITDEYGNNKPVEISELLLPCEHRLA